MGRTGEGGSVKECVSGCNLLKDYENRNLTCCGVLPMGYICSPFAYSKTWLVGQNFNLLLGDGKETIVSLLDVHDIGVR